MTMRRPWLAGLTAAVLFAACSGDTTSPPRVIDPPQTRPSLPQSYRPTGHAAAGDVFVHLFEWKWPDIARECETFLGPAGYHAVQVSPPQEHSVEASHTWSQRYQPVSYKLDRSRSGTRAEFIDMVNRCKAAGVGIYVDAIINHMTNFPSPGIGSAGSAYSKYSYPGLYTPADFHAPCALNNFQSAANVQDCELFSLPDLDTGSPSVRQKLANYLIELGRLGVAGFRIDAAKHIQPVELDSVMSLVNRAAAADGRPMPYVFAEVLDYGGEAVSKRDYYGLGYASGSASDITEVKVRGVGDKFIPLSGQYIAQLNPNGPSGSQFSDVAWGLMPADKAVVFLENHDTQRENGIGYRDGHVLRLAYVWLLAQPYGYPSVMSSYAFERGESGRRMGPPSNAAGETNDVVCASSMEAARIGDWVCEHRDAMIAAMIRFRRVVAGTPLQNWWDNGANAIAFSRGDRGFVAISRESNTVTATVTTPLAPGAYCDILSGGRSNNGCAGKTITVSANRTIPLELAANTAIAIHAGSRL